jgi:hypothetical protein
MRRMAFVGVFVAAAYLTGCQETKDQKVGPPFLPMPHDMDVNIYNSGPATQTTPAAGKTSAPLDSTRIHGDIQ